MKYHSSFKVIDPAWFAGEVKTETIKGLSLSFKAEQIGHASWNLFDEYQNTPIEINFPLELFTNKGELKNIIQQVILDYSKYNDILLDSLLRVGTSTHCQDIEIRPLGLTS